VAWLGLSSIYVSRILLMDHDYRIQNPADLNYYVRRLRLEDFSKPYVRLVLGDYVRMRSRDELVSIAELHSDIETIIMAAHMKIPEALNDEWFFLQRGRRSRSSSIENNAIGESA